MAWSRKGSHLRKAGCSSSFASPHKIAARPFKHREADGCSRGGKKDCGGLPDGFPLLSGHFCLFGDEEPQTGPAPTVGQPAHSHVKQQAIEKV